MGVFPKQLWLLNIALLIVGVMFPTVLLLGRVTESVATDVIDNNWRGEYDILVTHPDFVAEVSPANNDLGLPLVENNYGAVAAPTLSESQIEQLRSIPEIATVAPVGYLGSQIGTEKWLGIIIPWEALQPAQRTGFTFEIASKSHDGVS